MKDPQSPVPQAEAAEPAWKVGEFISSANRPTHVLMLAVGEKQIAEYGAHRDFIRWINAAPLPSPRQEAAPSAADGQVVAGDWYDRHEAECIKDYGEYDEEASLATRLRWWVPKCARHGRLQLEDDLLEAVEALTHPSPQVSPSQDGGASAAAEFRAARAALQAHLEGAEAEAFAQCNVDGQRCSEYVKCAAIGCRRATPTEEASHDRR